MESNSMESNSTAIMLLRWKPFIEELKQWVVEAREAGISDARMAGYRTSK
jgi:hypothetical protein